MSPEDREVISRSIANLWAFNAIVIGRLLGAMRDGGASGEQIEVLLQQLDADTDAILDGPHDQLYAAGLLATVRTVLASR